MRKSRPAHRSARSATRRPFRQRDYEVGYRRPPKHTRWKPGQSGNPKGRRKGAKNLNMMIHDLLTRKITVREGAKIRKATIQEAILVKFAETAMRGDPKAATFLLAHYDPVAIEQERPRRAPVDTKNYSADDALKVYQRLIGQVVG